MRTAQVMRIFGIKVDFICARCGIRVILLICRTPRQFPPKRSTLAYIPVLLWK
jgi:hypothetical protein